jgi:hypothetical protein
VCGLCCFVMLLFGELVALHWLHIQRMRADQVRTETGQRTSYIGLCVVGSLRTSGQKVTDSNFSLTTDYPDR